MWLACHFASPFELPSLFFAAYAGSGTRDTVAEYNYCVDTLVADAIEIGPASSPKIRLDIKAVWAWVERSVTGVSFY